MLWLWTIHLKIILPTNNSEHTSITSEILFPTNNSEHTSIATLDVTSEEIYCNQRSWSSIPSFQTESSKTQDFDQKERKRSETWTYGLSDHFSSTNRSLKVSDSFKEKAQISELYQCDASDWKSENESVAAQSEFSKVHAKSRSSLSTQNIASAVTVPQWISSRLKPAQNRRHAWFF